MRIKILAALFLGFAVSQLHAQAVYENYRNEIYNYLARMAQKGLIRFDDLVRPVQREAIALKLGELENIPDRLTAVEKKELEFYVAEYGDAADGQLRNDTSMRSNGAYFFRKDHFGRWRFFSGGFRSGQTDAEFHFDPIIEGTPTSAAGTYYDSRSVGAQFWGRVGKHIGFQFYAKDVTVSDRAAYKSLGYQPDPAGVEEGDTVSKNLNLNYPELRGSISYQWNNGFVSVGQDYLLWGYGLNGRIVLGDKAPAYPYIRLNYRPFSWLRFDYEHAFLSSDIVDSARSYSFGNTVYGGRSVVFIRKYMATHSLTATPWTGVDLSLGESVVYSNDLDAGYLIPVNFFKLYDNIRSNQNILAGGNSQLFFQASARNVLKNTHFYATLLVDEVRLGAIFDSKNARNQIGFNIGGSITDAFISYLTLSAEYTRVTPFVYRNLNPAADFTNHSIGIGDWMGNNFDRYVLRADYTPVPRVKTSIMYQGIRKGGPGTIDQQYFSQPQPSFLFDPKFNRGEFSLAGSWEITHNLYLKGNLDLYSDLDHSSGKQYTRTVAALGIHYSL